MAEPNNLPPEFEVSNYKIFQGMPSRVLNDGDSISFGNRTVRVIHTPGHSPGHMCFYEEETKMLFTGDLLYQGTMIAFFPTSDPVQYKQSVDRICALPIDRLLPAHHQLHIQPDFAIKVQRAFEEIKQSENLRHCGKTFAYQGFSIQL